MFHLLKTPFLAAPAEGFLALPFPLESSAFRLLAPGVGDGRTFERSDNRKPNQDMQYKPCDKDVKII